MKAFFLALVLQFASYLLLTVNYRAVAHKRPFWAMMTDGCCVLFSYFIIKQVTQSDGYTVLAGMVVGGSLAAGVGIWLTEHWD